MRNVYIDVATSGEWIWHEKDPVSIDQPHLVRLGVMEVVDADIVTEFCHLIKMPMGVKMSHGATLANGILDWQIARRGVSLSDAINELAEVLSKIYASSDGTLVVFNWSFVKHVLDISFRRPGYHTRDWSMPIFDIMKKAAPMVGKKTQPSSRTFLFPKYEEVTYKAIGKILRPTNDPIKDGLTRLTAMVQCHTACLAWQQQHEEDDD